jgi:hypothetical protein
MIWLCSTLTIHLLLCRRQGLPSNNTHELAGGNFRGGPVDFPHLSTTASELDFSCRGADRSHSVETEGSSDYVNPFTNPRYSWSRDRPPVRPQSTRAALMSKVMEREEYRGVPMSMNGYVRSDPHTSHSGL